MSKISTVSALAVAAVLAGALTTDVAMAQQSPQGTPAKRDGWGADMMMGPGMMAERGFGFMCNPRHAGLAEWRLKRIETEVKPTEVQKKALDDLRAASTKAAEIISTACAAPMPAKSTERMAHMEKRLEATLQAIKTVRPAFETFYGTLDEQQKTRLDAIGPRRWGWGNWRWPWS